MRKEGKKMEEQFNKPAQIIPKNIQAGITKATMPLGKMIMLGMLAGSFIALGGAASSVAAHNVSNVGLARLIMGAIFPVGLMMIVLVGGELFTGNCMIVMAVMDKKAVWTGYVRNLIVVYFSNLAGALIIDVLLLFSGQLEYSSGMMGAFAIKVAYGKVTISPLAGFTSGVLCNMLVCLAILMALAARDAAGKMLAVFFPIFAFVISGYEHCVANMYYIFMGILAKTNADYVQAAKELYGYTDGDLNKLTVVGSLKNFVPVTLGNIVGGAILIGAACYLVQKQKSE